MAVRKAAFDADMVAKTIALMKPDGELFEVRIISGSRKPISGYFTDADTLCRELKKWDLSDSNVYISLNSLNSACYARTQKDRFLNNVKSSTSDSDVEGYEWLMVDVDPKRPSDTSSSDEELEIAKEIGNKVFAFMRQIGFEKPLFALSGNGVHLLYRICLKNTTERKAQLETCLKTLSRLFSIPGVAEIDEKNFNPSRVCKLYGTRSAKGSDTAERPHRMSEIVGSPTEIKATDAKYVEKLAGMYPTEPDKPQEYNNHNPQKFDLESWLTRYGFNYKKIEYKDSEKFILDRCPFDSNHKDSCVFRNRNGALSFFCFHNSCTGKTWQDVRMKLDPTYEEKKQQWAKHMMYDRPNRIAKKITYDEQKGSIFLTALEILDSKAEDETFVPTGIKTIDERLRGLKKGYVSVLSGLRAGGKTTILDMIGLTARQAGNNVAYFSGELSPKNFMKWMNLQAAGKGYVEATQFIGHYKVPYKVQKAIAEWLNGHFWLYNNLYGNDFNALITEFRKIIQKNKLDILIIDNLMALDTEGLSDDKYKAQSKFVLKLKQLAVEENVHILFVAHPRKSQGFLRLDDISGTADLANAVDNAFIIHRVNNDFKRLSKAMFFWKEDSEPGSTLYFADNVIEIAKDRDGGICDMFIPLYYEPETKRMKNDPAENVIYGWNYPDIKKYGEPSEEEAIGSFDASAFGLEEFEERADEEELPF